MKERDYSPKDIWSTAKHFINPEEESLLIADDLVLSKTYSKKIELIHYQYSGNEHDVVAGIGDCPLYARITLLYLSRPK